MIKTGTILGDRYEILEKIGTGGMAEVFKGKDHKQWSAPHRKMPGLLLYDLPFHLPQCTDSEDFRPVCRKHTHNPDSLFSHGPRPSLRPMSALPLTSLFQYPYSSF